MDGGGMTIAVRDAGADLGRQLDWRVDVLAMTSRSFTESQKRRMPQAR
jgi:hypothetical protein